MVLSTPLVQRVVFGSVTASLLLVALFFSTDPRFGFFFPLVIISLSFFALKEYFLIAKAKGLYPLEKLAIATAITYLLAAYFSAATPAAYILPGAVAWIAFAFAFAYYFIYGSAPLPNLAATMFGIVYIVFPLGYGIAINYFPSLQAGLDSRFWLLYLLIVAKASDMAAYFVGRKVGRHALCPYLSPNKTWEGALAGATAAIAASVIIHLCGNVFTEGQSHLTLFTAIWLGAAIGLLAAFGDLAESLLKRDSNLKDSNKFMPGIGGFLDMLDSLLFAAPALYFLLRSGVLDNS